MKYFGSRQDSGKWKEVTPMALRVRDHFIITDQRGVGEVKSRSPFIITRERQGEILEPAGNVDDNGVCVTAGETAPIIKKMVNKKSQFVKNIEKIEREGCKVDGAVVLFTSETTGASSLIVEGDCTSSGVIVLRANEHLKLEMALAKSRREAYVESETKSVLGNGDSKSPSYTN